MPDQADTLIIGAGAAGLAGAFELASADHHVVVLEARERLGGRILTERNTLAPVPMELGAEFIHGESPAIMHWLKAANDVAIDASRNRWMVHEGKLRRCGMQAWLWLSEFLRLGPPSRYPDTLIGPQVIIVDAIVEGIGAFGINANFQRLLRELRLVLSPILGVHLEDSVRSRSVWAPDFDEQGQILDCRLRPIGYTELGLPPGMPTPGAVQAVVFETVTRPNLGRYGIWADDRSERVPHDIGTLWTTFCKLPSALSTQFLNACNAYDIAGAMWPDQRTAYAVFLVVACEALKPTGAEHDKANVYDVVASLLDACTAEELRKLRVPPQHVRSKHLHRGVVVADEMRPLLFGDPFGDPSFDTMVRVQSQVTRKCLIEWLRREGRYALTLLPRPISPRSRLRRRMRTRRKRKS